MLIYVLTDILIMDPPKFDSKDGCILAVVQYTLAFEYHLVPLSFSFEASFVVGI